MDTSEIKRDKIAKYLKLGMTFVGLVVVAPFVFLAVKGLIGLVIAGVIGLGVVQFSPVVAIKFANWKMKLIVDDASKNPIETMKNIFISKTEELQHADENITAFDTEVENFDDQLEGFNKQYPDEAEKYQALSEKMHQALQDMMEQQKDARVALRDFEGRIKKAEAIYRMACAAQKVLTLQGSAESQVFDQIRTQVAFDSVRTQLNSAFAKLSMTVERRNEMRQLSNSGSATVVPLKITKQDHVGVRSTH